MTQRDSLTFAAGHDFVIKILSVPQQGGPGVRNKLVAGLVK